MSQQRDRSCLILRSTASEAVTGVLLTYVLLAAWYSLTIPLGEAPDEVPHFTYIRYLAQHGHLPTTTEEHEAFQPPLYYALGAALTFWIEDLPQAPFVVRANAHFDLVDERAPKNLLLHTSDEAWPFRGWALAWRLVRLLSIALGAVTVWAIYQLGRVLFPRQPAVPLTMAALTAFTPQFLFLTAVVNNDNAATAFAALILWQVAALFHERRCSRLWKRSALRSTASEAVLGVLVGLGLMSKANLIALLPAVGLAIVVSNLGCRAPTAKDSPQEPEHRILLLTLGRLTVTFGLAALLSGWYFIRNWIRHGDPMAWSFLLEINARREGPLTPEVLAWLFKGIYRSFWLGWIGIQFDEAIYWLIGAACAVGVLGFALWLARRWRSLAGGARWTLVALGLHAAITLASLLQWTATVLGTDQGRLVYPVLPTVMLILAAGWAWWARGRWQGWALGGLAAGMLALAILTPIRYIAPVHAGPPRASEAELSAATPLDVDWADIRLLGYRLENNRVQPGGKLVLDLYWQALQPMERDLMAFIQLVDNEGAFLLYLDGSPSAGRDTTDRWTPGERLASRHLLAVPDYGQPGAYRLTISVRPFGESTWLPAVGPDGTMIGDQLVLPETITLDTR